MNDMIIVGGGVMGMLCARELLQQGATVTLIEKSEPGREASWAGGGIVSPLYPWHYVPAISALATWAQASYPRLTQQLREETGIDAELNPCGLLMLDPPEAEQALDWARRFDKIITPVDKTFVARREPSATSDFSTALWLPYVSNVRNPRLLQALRVSLEKNPGFTLVSDTEITDIRRDADGNARVCSSTGEWQGDKVMLCTGAWSGRLLQPQNIQLPVVPVRGQMLLFEQRPGLIKSVILKAGKYLIPRLDGHILVGSTTEEAGFEKVTTAEARELLLGHAFSIAPALKEVPVVHHWAGLRPGSPGGLPFIGRVPGWNNLFLNAGHYRNGLVLAPASARLMRDLVLGQSPIVDPAPYDPARVREPMAMI